MKMMIKIMFYLAALILLLHCGYYDPIDLDPIPNVTKSDPKVDIPDKNFLRALIERGVDMNQDGFISKSEAERKIALYINDESIADLTGIEAFRNLITLKCDRNPLMFLSVYQNSGLVNLSCEGIKLDHLYLDKNIQLKFLQCDGCELHELWVSTNIKLEKLSCSNNKLTFLDFSNNKKLEYVALKDMPSLSKVCVWELPFPPEGIDIDTTHSPNIYFTTSCMDENPYYY
jgi:hypothetical protein